MDASGLSAARLGSLYAAGETDPSEVLAATLERIDRLDGALGAFAEVTAERATAEAAERTAELRRGESRGPLHGVPVAVKELFDVAGAVGDYGSEVLAGRVPDADAELVRRLRAAGAVIVGVTRSHELGWGITSQHARRSSPRNPWNLNRVPGGSSGGSAAAVAAGMVPAAVASDTGGSVRIPATFCGVAGIKPTLGRISRTGGLALAPTLDTPGVVAGRVEDLWPMLAAMSGPHPGDPAALADPLPVAVDPGSFAAGLAGVRVGLAPCAAGAPCRGAREPPQDSTAPVKHCAPPAPGSSTSTCRRRRKCWPPSSHCRWPRPTTSTTGSSACFPSVRTTTAPMSAGASGWRRR